MSWGHRWVIATTNLHKLAELRAMISAIVPDADVESLAGLDDVPEIEETAVDFAGNALLKARGIADWLAGRGESGMTLVLADDSGICVDVLRGAPGVRSARFAGERSDDQANNRQLCTALAHAQATASPAHYACVLALVRVDGGALTPDGEAQLLFHGRWDVEVRAMARGEGGFGYDPHAWIEGGARTVAELAAQEKARLSHRGQAARALEKWCQEHLAGGKTAP